MAEPPDAQGAAADRRPSGNEVAPAFPTFLSRLFDEKTGAFQVLGHTVGAEQGNGVPLEVSTVDVKKAEPSTVFDRDGLTVTAFGIPHANVPTLAYRVETRGVSVVFSSDQNGTDPKFVDFAKGADVLVMHLAIAAGATSPLHAAPAVVGRIAQDAGVKRLIVSHIGLFDLDAAIAELKKAYTGPADRRRRPPVHAGAVNRATSTCRWCEGRRSAVESEKEKGPACAGPSLFLGRKHPTEDALNVAQAACLVVAEMSHIRRNASAARAGKSKNSGRRRSIRDRAAFRIVPPRQRKRKRPRLRGAKWYLGRKHPTEDAGNLTQTAWLLVAEKSHARQSSGPSRMVANGAVDTAFRL